MVILYVLVVAINCQLTDKTNTKTKQNKQLFCDKNNVFENKGAKVPYMFCAQILWFAINCSEWTTFLWKK